MTESKYSEVVQLCRQMVAISSINPQENNWTDEPYGEARMADFVYNWLAKYNLNPVKLEAVSKRENVFATIEGENKSRTLLVCGHMDTVDVKGMTVEPFKAVAENGKIFGRGSCDTKGPLAAMMIAFRNAAQNGTLPCNLTFLASCGEEFDMLGARAYAKQAGHSLSAAVFCEPTDMKIITCHKGVVRLKLTCLGHSAHSSDPQQGENAIYTMADAIKIIRNHLQNLSKKPPHARLGTETLAVTIVKGGSQINIIPDYCQAQIDWRILIGREGRDCLDELSRELAKEIPQEKFKLELMGSYEPMETDENSPLIKSILEACEKTSLKTQTQAAPYGTDAGSFARFNIPMAVFGPGAVIQAHTKDEFIEIQQLEKGLAVYEAFLAGSLEI